MTKQETESLLRYMISMYPNVRMTDQQFGYTVQIWSTEFKDETKEIVGEAFRLARMESPDWMPSIPRIQHSIQIVLSRMRTKSPEQEFMDSHCGKTKEEWDRLLAWEKSPAGASKVKSYKEQFAKLIGESA